MKDKKIQIRLSKKELDRLEYISHVWNTNNSEMIRLLINFEFNKIIDSI